MRALLLLVLVPAAHAAPAAFLEKHCVGCHNAKTKRADVSLHAIKADADWAKDRKLADKVLRMLKAGDMPPPAKPRPPVRSPIALHGAIVRGCV